MFDRLIRLIARRAYRNDYQEGYEAGRDSHQQQSYAQGYRDGKVDGRAAEQSDVRATRAKLDESYRWGWEEGRAVGLAQAALYQEMDATRDSSQGHTTKAA